MAAKKNVKGALFIDTNALVYANVLEAPLHGKALAAITAAFESGWELWISRANYSGISGDLDPATGIRHVAEGDGVNSGEPVSGIIQCCR